MSAAAPQADRRVRILFVSEAGDALGGAERSLLALAENLDQARYVLHAVLGGEGRFATLLRGAHVDVAVRRLGAVARTRNPLKLLLYAGRLLRGVLALARLIRRWRIDIVHANQNTVAVHAVPAAWLAGAACVWHVRNRARRFGHVGGWLVRHCPRLVFVSESIAGPFREAFPEETDRFVVVPEGLDNTLYAAREMGTDFRDALGVQPGERLVGTVGRLTPWKGQDDFLRAAARVAERHPGARFLVVGDCLGSRAERRADEAFRDRLHALADQLALAERVRFTGYREDVAAVMNALDVFVLPSHDEPFGIVVLEAMAAGRPIVATDAGGVPEIVRHETEALLVPPGEPDAMAAAVGRLLDDPTLADRLARAAEERVAAEFPLWRQVARLREVYERLAVERRG